jgi:hypothetical protein
MIGIPLRKRAPKGDVAQRRTKRGGPRKLSLLIAIRMVRRAEDSFVFFRRKTGGDG